MFLPPVIALLLFTKFVVHSGDGRTLFDDFRVPIPGHFLFEGVFVTFCLSSDFLVLGSDLLGRF